MFGKFKAGYKPPQPHDGGQNPWDAETIAKVCTADRITFDVNHVGRHFLDGAFGTGKETTFDKRPTLGHLQEPKFGERSTVGTGVLSYAGQHVHVEVFFEQDMEEFGVIVLSWQYDERYLTSVVNMPVLKVVLRDREGETANVLHEAMRDAVQSGRGGVEVRVWINFGPGWDDREHAVYGNITGAQIWSNLHKPSLPTWARPIGELDLSDYPNPAMLRSSQKG